MLQFHNTYIQNNKEYSNCVPKFTFASIKWYVWPVPHPNNPLLMLPPLTCLYANDNHFSHGTGLYLCSLQEFTSFKCFIIFLTIHLIQPALNATWVHNEHGYSGAECRYAGWFEGQLNACSTTKCILMIVCTFIPFIFLILVWQQQSSDY